jgi:hypothetical protein
VALWGLILGFHFLVCHDVDQMVVFSVGVGVGVGCVSVCGVG